RGRRSSFLATSCCTVSSQRNQQLHGFAPGYFSPLDRYSQGSGRHQGQAGLAPATTTLITVVSTKKRCNSIAFLFHCAPIGSMSSRLTPHGLVNIFTCQIRSKFKNEIVGVTAQVGPSSYCQTGNISGKKMRAVDDLEARIRPATFQCHRR